MDRVIKLLIRDAINFLHNYKTLITNFIEVNAEIVFHSLSSNNKDFAQHVVLHSVACEE